MLNLVKTNSHPTQGSRHYAPYISLQEATNILIKNRIGHVFQNQKTQYQKPVFSMVLNAQKNHKKGSDVKGNDCPFFI